jgi:Flp pilus assembly protein CpaB
MNAKRLVAVATLIEFVGMLVLLGGALWQAKMSGWWDQQLPEWQYYIQEDVNLAVLGSIKDLSSIVAASDQQFKTRLLADVEKRTWDAMSKAIHERETRSKAIDGGQASAFWNIRDFLMLSGAVLLVAGKFVAMKAAFKEAGSPVDNQAPTTPPTVQ